ncbi:VOC family protein [Nocardia sp. NBC_01503]|uniref:VOC family protein n=1 Tax=Nocardia sp. NBC_01503 TaxID=2975997 RepID=UPI002E7B4367|nr:VOC family protein [Nocardia sp. NBC_01503]WTL30408.1 VOC family protein [Nocardia sp. NBC_01503]
MSGDGLGLLSYAQTRVLVDDFAPSYRFYRETLGLPLKHQDESGLEPVDGPYACFVAGDADLALFQRAFMEAAVGAEHRPREGVDAVVVVLRVADVDAAAEVLESRGAELAAAPVYQEAWGMRVAHLRAPEGTLIELCQYDG